MKKEVIIRFDEEAYRDYEILQQNSATGKRTKKNPSYEQLLTSLDKALKNIAQNPTYGNLIPRKILNSSIIKKYGTDKIFRVELVGYWRLLYTLIGDEIRIIVLILEYMDHKDYDKLFGYKKK